MKKKLTQHEEFEILKLVLDKLLWLGFGIMAFGFYQLATVGIEQLWRALAFVITGIVLLVVFVIIMVKEYEIVAK
ncbi:MAG: hypothetical protein ACOCWQ_06290 [Nanoarchaeota archaeon]